MIEKECTKCKVVKSGELFAKRSSSSDGLASWCKRCFADHAAKTYKINEAERDRKKRNKERLVDANKQKLWDYLLTHPCVDCNISDPRVLEFDHRDELEKSRNVTEMFQWSWSTIEYEIAKCDVRCANCHRIRTQLQFGTWRGKIQV